MVAWLNQFFPFRSDTNANLILNRPSFWPQGDAAILGGEANTDPDPL
jgi:hypothetical protein